MVAAPEHERVYVFERFSDQGRHILVLAQVEARLLAHSYVGPEHILLGIIHDGQSVAAVALSELGVTLEGARERLEEIVGSSSDTGASEYPTFTSPAKNVLEFSLQEAQQLGHNHIGPEHMLLSLVHGSDGVVAEVLVSLGAELEAVRQRVLDLLPPPGEAAPVGATGMSPVGPWSHDAFATAGSAGEAEWRGACSFCGRDLREVSDYVAAGAAAICATCAFAAAETIQGQESAWNGAVPVGQW